MLYDLIMDELNSREIYRYETYAPYYIASFFMHVFNLYNRKHKIFWIGKTLPSWRLHILMVAPPGFAKSYFIEQLLNGENAIFRDCGVKVGFEQYMTEAGFVGSVSKDAWGVPQEDTIGAAKEFAEGIIGVDEFAGITDAFNQANSNQLRNQLLSALDSGKVCKRLRDGKLEYETQVTLWAGTQPTRIDLSSGLGRRFLILLFLPTKKDIETLREYWWKAKNIKPDKEAIVKLRTMIKNFRNGLGMVKSIEFDDSVLKLYKKYSVTHYEGNYFDRLLIGYHLARYGIDQKIVITDDGKDIRKLIKQQIEWRRKVAFGAQYTHVVDIIKEDGLDGKTISVDDLVETLTIAAQIDIKAINEILTELRKMQVIKQVKNRVVLNREMWKVDSEEVMV